MELDFELNVTSKLANKDKEKEAQMFNPSTYVDTSMDFPLLPIPRAYHYLPYESGAKRGNYQWGEGKQRGNIGRGIIGTNYYV